MTVKVSPKFQVVIPEAIREEIGLKVGTHVQVLSKGNVIFLVPVQTFDETAKKYGSFFEKSDLESIRDKRDRKR